MVPHPTVVRAVTHISNQYDRLESGPTCQMHTACTAQDTHAMHISKAGEIALPGCITLGTDLLPIQSLVSPHLPSAAFLGLFQRSACSLVRLGSGSWTAQRSFPLPRRKCGFLQVF